MHDLTLFVALKCSPIFSSPPLFSEKRKKKKNKNTPLPKITLHVPLYKYLLLKLMRKMMDHYVLRSYYGFKTYIRVLKLNF